MYVFTDYVTGLQAYFTSEEKANQFKRDYFKVYGELSECRIDKIIATDLDFNDWRNDVVKDIEIIFDNWRG